MPTEKIQAHKKIQERIRRAIDDVQEKFNSMLINKTSDGFFIQKQMTLLQDLGVPISVKHQEMKIYDACINEQKRLMQYNVGYIDTELLQQKNQIMGQLVAYLNRNLRQQIPCVIMMHCECYIRANFVALSQKFISEKKRGHSFFAPDQAHGDSELFMETPKQTEHSVVAQESVFIDLMQCLLDNISPESTVAAQTKGC